MQKKAAIGAATSPTWYQPLFMTEAARSTVLQPLALKRAGQLEHFNAPSTTCASH